MREAVRVLEAHGLLTSRRRVGLVVRPQAEWDILNADIIEWSLDSPRRRDVLIELTDLRVAVEPVAADEFVVVLATPDQCREVRARLDQACEKAGRDPAAVSLSLFTGLCVAENEGTLADRLERLLANTRPHMRDTTPWIYGTPQQAAERVRALEDAGVDRLMFSVENDLHLAMIPVIGNDIAPLLG